MDKKNRCYLICLSAGITFLLGIMIFKAPFRVDDLTWGARIGRERLQRHFAGYNGRYAGNLVVLTLTRLPAVIRTAVELAVIWGLIVSACNYFRRNTISTVVFALLFFAMPLTIFSQTVTWISGFSNYVVSAAIVMALISFDFDILNDREITDIKNMVLMIILAFSGQLFVENVTLYLIALPVLMSGLFYFRKRRLSKVLLYQIAAAAAGALLMFSNSAYRSAFTHDGGSYKSIDYVGFWKTLKAIAVTYRDLVSVKWFTINLPVNLIIASLLTIGCLSEKKKKTDFFWGVVGAAFLSVFLYDLVDGDNKTVFSPSFGSIVSMLFVIYIAVVIFCVIEDREIKGKLAVLLCSNIILMLPLNIVSPIADRCFLSTYMLWVLIAVELMQPFLEKCLIKSKNMNGIVIPGIMIMVFLLCGIKGQSFSWKIEKIRMAEIKACKENNAGELYLPIVPHANLYCAGANTGGTYWKNNYKEYYGIDEDVELNFIEYDEYLEKYSK